MISQLTKVKSIEFSEADVLALFETKYGYIVYKLLDGEVDISDFLLDLNLALSVFDNKLNSRAIENVQFN